MDTERDGDAAVRDDHFMVRVLTNLNAGAMLALCLWLASAALEYEARAGSAGKALNMHDCGCAMSEVTDRSGRFDVASSQ